MEHDNLQRVFLIGGLAAVAACVLAVVMLVSWLQERRHGRSVTLVSVVFLISVGVAGLSAGWLTSQRHEKCGRTVARTLCESPINWLRAH